MPHSPEPNDLLVRREHGHYFVVNAVTAETLAGPYHRREFAFGIAESLAHKLHANVWRDSSEEGDRSFGPPELVTDSRGGGDEGEAGKATPTP